MQWDKSNNFIILFIVLSCMIIFGFLPWMIYELRHNDKELHVQAWFIAGVFMCLSIPLTFYDISQHFRHWNQPDLQKYIVRILLMIPVYSVDSFLALRFVDIYIYIDAIRECYEAYVIYNFYMYLLTYLKSDPNFNTILTTRTSRHVFPLCCLPTWDMEYSFLRQCTIGVTIYILVKPILALITIICELTDTYKEGHWTYSGGYTYVAIINSLCQCYAMYCLVLLYLIFKQDLSLIKPIPKFLIIKAVVFLSFWQSVLIAILIETKVIESNPNWTKYNNSNVAASIQDFIICIEMFLAALVHNRVFSYKEYKDPDGDQERLNTINALHNLFNISDVKQNVVGVFKNKQYISL